MAALALDAAGTRLASGGYDYELRFWDFAGMDSQLRSFRTVEPCAGHALRSLCYNTRGSHILAVAGSAQAYVLDREGVELFASAKGNSQLFDAAKTHGHTAQVNAGAWHPRDPLRFATCSNDGTVRVWSTSDDAKRSVVVGKCRTRRGKRAPVTCLAFSRDGARLAAGCSDGSLQIFSLTTKLMRPLRQLHEAHAEGEAITACVYSRDNSRLVSRSCDGTLKCWRTANMRSSPAARPEPEHALGGLPCFYDSTDCIYSPDERWILTGTSAPKRGSDGAIVFVSATTFTVGARVAEPGAGVISLLWSLRLNQIFVGRSDGVVQVLFDPKKSVRGALLCAERAPRKRNPLDMLQFGDQAAAVYEQQAQRQKQQEAAKRKRALGDGGREQERARKTRRPQPPVKSEHGVGQGGRLAGNTTSLGQYIARRTAVDPTLGEDPREAILRHAEAAESDPIWSKAYAKTQPNPIYDMDADPYNDGTEHVEHKFDPKRKKSAGF